MGAARPTSSGTLLALQSGSHSSGTPLAFRSRLSPEAMSWSSSVLLLLQSSHSSGTALPLTSAEPPPPAMSVASSMPLPLQSSRMHDCNTASKMWALISAWMMVWKYRSEFRFPPLRVWLQ